LLERDRIPWVRFFLPFYIVFNNFLGSFGKKRDLQQFHLARPFPGLGRLAAPVLSTTVN